MTTLSYDHSPIIYRYLVCRFFIIMSISDKICRPSVFDSLGSYISIVNNFIILITPHWLTFINYIYQHMD